MQDDDSVKAQSVWYVAYNGAVETVDGLIGAWLELGALLDAVTGAAIRKGSVNIPLSPDVAWKTTPIAGHSVSDTLNLRFGNAATIYKDTYVIPALRDTLVADGGPILTAAGAIDDVAQKILTGFTNANYVNESGDGLNVFDAGFQGVRKHRQQLTARSLRHP